MTADTAETLAAPDDVAVVAEPALLGLMDATFRIALPAPGSERTFRLALLGVVLVYTALLSLFLLTSAGAPPEPRGQVEGPPSIDVEIVEEPSPEATTKRSQSGVDAPVQPSPAEMPAPPPPPPSPEVAAAPPPTPPAPPKPAETQPAPPPPVEAPPVEKVEKPAETAALPPPPSDEPALEPMPEPAKEPVPEPPKPEPQAQPKKPELAKPKSQADPSLEGFDLSMDKYAAAVDAEIERRKRERHAKAQQPQQPIRPDMSLSGGSMRVRGAAKSGKTDEYSRSVIAALIKTKPKPFAIRGSVMVSFEIGPGGALKYVKLVDSSGNTAMDDVALSAIRRAIFMPPPPTATPSDLTYIIHYVFD